MNRYMGAGVIVFINGFVILGVQTLGSKLFAAQVGTTAPVWAALIAVVITASSIGYYLGGRFISARYAGRAVGYTLLLAALYLYLSGSLGVDLLSSVTYGSYAFRAFNMSLLLFFIPTLLISAATVFATRAVIADNKDQSLVGQTAGRLYAVATIGSAAGIFGLAYVFIPLLPLSQIMHGMVAALAIGAISAFIFLSEKETA